MSPDSLQSQIAALKQRVEDLADVVGKFGQVLVDQVRMEEQLKQGLARLKEIEADVDDQVRHEEKIAQLQRDLEELKHDRKDSRRYALTTTIAIGGLVVVLAGLIFTILTFAGHG